MEAGWSVEIGADLPGISVPWAADSFAFADLRNHPEAAATLPEAQAYPALAQALAELNSATSLLFTSKCDVWDVAAQDLDPLEMGSAREEARTGVACYIDLVRSGDGAFEPFTRQEAWLERITATLRATPAGMARVEFVLRQAVLTGGDGEGLHGFGVTFYVTGCGRDRLAALCNWQAALAASIPVVAAAA